MTMQHRADLILHQRPVHHARPRATRPRRAVAITDGRVPRGRRTTRT